MSRVVSSYFGVKRSLQPHGLRSRLTVAVVLFIGAFGGALALVSPASANPPFNCAVAVTPTVDPSVSPAPTDTPTPVLSPTPCPTVTVTITQTQTVTVPVPGPTVTVTKVITKTVTVNQTQTQVQTQTVFITPSPTPTTPAPPVSTTAARPTPTPLAAKLASNDSSWGVVAVIVGVVCLILLLLFLVTKAFGGRIRGLVDEPSTGRHSVDNSETQVMPAYHDPEDDGYSVGDYHPEGGYSPELGGSAGSSRHDSAEALVGDEPTESHPVADPPANTEPPAASA